MQAKAVLLGLIFPTLSLSFSFLLIFCHQFGFVTSNFNIVIMCAMDNISAQCFILTICIYAVFCNCIVVIW